MYWRGEYDSTQMDAATSRRMDYVIKERNRLLDLLDRALDCWTRQCGPSKSIPFHEDSHFGNEVRTVLDHFRVEEAGIEFEHKPVPHGEGTVVWDEMCLAIQELQMLVKKLAEKIP